MNKIAIWITPHVSVNVWKKRFCRERKEKNQKESLRFDKADNTN